MKGVDCGEKFPHELPQRALQRVATAAAAARGLKRHLESSTAQSGSAEAGKSIIRCQDGLCGRVMVSMERGAGGGVDVVEDAGFRPLLHDDEPPCGRGYG